MHFIKINRQNCTRRFQDKRHENFQTIFEPNWGFETIYSPRPVCVAELDLFETSNAQRSLKRFANENGNRLIVRGLHLPSSSVSSGWWCIKLKAVLGVWFAQPIKIHILLKIFVFIGVNAQSFEIGLIYHLNFEKVLQKDCSLNPIIRRRIIIEFFPKNLFA